MTQVIKQDIVERIADSFMNYSMYVITDRALPDARDGLKPVQRRILYSMNNLGLHNNKSYKKSARTVGDVLGLWHPHGDSSVYEAMVKLAQPFNMNYPLVDGHGNFGSIDGDAAAAMRYTEAKMSKAGERMLLDINKDTVDFDANFDDSATEPTVLPTMFPNLLVNGSSGIAVGMSTTILPHNAHDIYEALIRIVNNTIDGKDTPDSELIDIVKAPDFPTGGRIINASEAKRAYLTGKGRIITQSVYEIEDIGKGRQQIVFTEIPYKINKSKILEKIDDLRRHSIEDIKEARDESDKDGIRIVVELKKSTNPDFVLKRLFKQTQLQDSITMNMVALVDNKPVQLTLKQALDEFLAHVGNIIVRRSMYDLTKAETRNHIVDGILLTLEDIDAIVKTIKSSESSKTVILDLISKHGLSEVQAKHISDMKLRALTKASKQEYLSEKELLLENIEKWRSIVENRPILLQEILHTLTKEQDFYNAPRRTEVLNLNQDITEKDLIKKEDLIFTMTKNNIIKLVRTSDYEAKGRGTKGSKGQSVQENDSVFYMLSTNTRDDLLFFTNLGKCHVVEAHRIPITTKSQSGKYVNNFLDLEDGEEILNVMTKECHNDGDLFFATKKGIGKRLSLSELSTARKSTKVITFKDDDELVAVKLIDGHSPIVVFSALGQAVKFNPYSKKNGIRSMGRSAAGVKIITLVGDDFVSGISEAKEGHLVSIISELGVSKTLEFDSFSLLTRGAKGVKSMNLTDKTGVIAAVATLKPGEDLFIATKEGIINRISSSTIRVLGRTATGAKAITLNDSDVVKSMVAFPSEKNDEAEDN